jgi:hypothetical protein
MSRLGDGKQLVAIVRWGYARRDVSEGYRHYDPSRLPPATAKSRQAMNTAQLVLKTLRDTRDVAALRDAIASLGGPAGPVVSSEFIVDATRRIVLCVLEMKWPLPEWEVRELGAYAFGNTVCLEFQVGTEILGSVGMLLALPAYQVHRGGDHETGNSERAAACT